MQLVNKTSSSRTIFLGRRFKEVFNNKCLVLISAIGIQFLLQNIIYPKNIIKFTKIAFIFLKVGPKNKKLHRSMNAQKKIISCIFSDLMFIIVDHRDIFAMYIF